MEKNTSTNIELFQVQGHRAYQQDRHVIAAPGGGHLLAVLDGHGGEAVSDAAAIRLPHYFSESLGQGLRPRDALEAAVLRLIDDHAESVSGSTLSAAYIEQHNDGLIITTAQLGDSAVAILTPDDELICTPEHAADDDGPDYDRIMGDPRGAVILRGYLSTIRRHDLSISMTRALGDHDIDVMVREPDIATHQVPAGSIVLLCSDGVHIRGSISLHIERYRELLRFAKSKMTVQEIGEHVLRHSSYGGDNTTLIVYRAVEFVVENPAPRLWF